MDRLTSNCSGLCLLFALEVPEVRIIICVLVVSSPLVSNNNLKVGTLLDLRVERNFVLRFNIVTIS